jgi:hypothetical protein
MPTKIRTAPPNRLIDRVFVFNERTTLVCVKLMAITSTIIMRAIVNAAVPKAKKATVSLPIVRACKARPARIGPVQPKPAKM